MQQSLMSVRSRAIDRRQMGSSFRRLMDRLVAISQGVWIYLTSSLSKQAEGIRADILYRLQINDTATCTKYCKKMTLQHVLTAVTQ